MQGTLLVHGGRQTFIDLATELIPILAELSNGTDLIRECGQQIFELLLVNGDLVA